MWHCVFIKSTWKYREETRGLVDYLQTLRTLHLPSIDKVDELIRESVVSVGEARGVALHDQLQLLEDGAPARVGEVPGGHLHQRDAQRPHVGADVVAARSPRVDTLRLRHNGRFARDSRGRINSRQSTCDSLSLRNLVLWLLMRPSLALRFYY